MQSTGHYTSAPIELEWKRLFGRLLYIFLIRLPTAPLLGLEQNTTVAFAAIHKCDVKLKDPDLNIHYYKTMSNVDIVDITTVKALVGRVGWDSWWAIIDRGAGLVDPSEDEEEDEEE